jgi:hypothetical protein
MCFPKQIPKRIASLSCGKLFLCLRFYHSSSYHLYYTNRISSANKTTLFERENHCTQPTLPIIISSKEQSVISQTRITRLLTTYNSHSHGHCTYNDHRCCSTTSGDHSHRHRNVLCAALDEEEANTGS